MSIMKKMLERKNYESYVARTFLLGFDIAEIDKIMVERTCCGLIQSAVSKISELVCDEVIDDQISKLPDEILCSIISLLTMREAARTSILSRRWKDLWRRTLNLNFDIVNKCGDSYFMSKFLERDAELLMQDARCKFVSWVDQILPFLCGSRIETFRLRHCLGKEHACHIDRWIQFAVDREVQNVDLDLSKIDLFSLGHEPYSFPSWLFVEGRGSSLKHLSLKYCSPCTPQHFSSFKSLMSLTLREISLTQGHLESFLSGCISLEWLSLTNCRCPSSLKVVGPCLKHFSISFCSGLEEIEISAINLVSYEQRGSMLRFSFKQIPRSLMRSTLLAAELDGLFYALGLAGDFPSLETLHLISWPIKEKSLLPNLLPTFTKLKKLELTITHSKLVSLLPFTSLFEAAPFLHKFELHLYSASRLDGTKKYRKKRSRCPHIHLKEVQIHGFCGDYVELEFAVYLLNNAIFLEKMELNTTRRAYLGDGEYIIGDGPTTKIPSRKISKLLQKKAPSTCTARILVL